MSDSDCSAPGQQIADARKEHERALNRARQRRYQARKRMITNGLLVDDNGQPNSSVQRVALGLLHGLNDSQALIQSGSSRKAMQLLDRAKVGLSEQCKAHGITITTLLENVRRRDKATTPMLTAEGSIEKPDWQAQASAARDMVQVLDRAGELPAAQGTEHHGSSIHITYNRVEVGLTNAIHKGDSQAINVTNEKRSIEGID